MEPGRRRALAVGAVALAAGGAGAFLGPFALQRHSGAAALLATVFPDLDGQARRVRDWSRRVAVCNFWATWCEPCREEIPLLIDLRQKYASAGAEVVGIGIDTVAKIREFAAIYKITYPLLVGDARALDLMRELGNQAGALPYTVVLARDGTVAYRKLGPLARGELEGILPGLLG